MKKILCLLLASLMIFAAVPVLAEEQVNVTDCTTEGGLNFQERTQAYMEAMGYYDRMGAYGLKHKTETDYGTLVEYSVMSVTSSTINHIDYIRYDGEKISVSQYAPNRDEENKMKYEKLEVSSDGKWATITYPELKNTGTFTVIVDLVNCTAKREIIPYVKKEEPTEEATEEIIEPAVGGLCEGYFWVDEGSCPEATVEWEYYNSTLTISGTGDMHDFYYTYGGRVQYTTTIGKPWKAYYEKIKKVVIKEGVNSTSRYVFEDCVNLEEVVIGDNVTIGTESFKNLRNIEKITLGKNCTIGQRAFINCTALMEVTLTEGTELDYGVFADCYALSEINFDGSGISVHNSSFKGTPFYDKTEIIYINNELLWIKNAGALETYTIPEGTTRIGGFVFALGKIKEINFPESLVEIGQEAFEYSKLTRVSLNEGIKKIDDSAFHGCNVVLSDLPESLEYLGDKAFASTGITGVTIRKNLVVKDAGVNEDGAFSNCKNLHTVTIEDGVEKIANGMFEECYLLKNVSIPDSVKVIGNRAFEGCYNLTQMPMGNGVTEIGAYAFSGCSNIPNADISHVENVGNGVFYKCKSLEKVILNENMTKIPNSFIEGCVKLQEIKMPENITSIGHYAFRYTESLTGEFKIPETVTKIGEWAFEESGYSVITVPDGVTEVGTGFARTMKNLTKVSLPEGITKIPPKSFEGCSNLTEVIIPSTVIEIGYEAFDGCESLSETIIPEGVTEIGYLAFSNCKKLESITLPQNITAIKYGLFKNCESLKNVTIKSENITSIGKEAFYGCSSLNEINIPDTITEIGPNAFTNSGILNNPIYWDGCVMYISNCVVATRYASECVKIRPGTRAIAAEAFAGRDIYEIHIPGSVKTIASYAFEKSKTKKFVLEEGIETIDGDAFYFADVEQINFPDSLLLIENSAFSGCDNLKEVVVPCKVHIKVGAFSMMELEKVTFKEGREEIDMSDAFGYFVNVKEVVLPEGLKKIGDSMFSDWRSLEKINCPESLEEIGKRAFYNCDKLIGFSGSENLKTIGEDAFKGCNVLEKVTFNPDAQIGEGAFDECPNLILQ